MRTVRTKFSPNFADLGPLFKINSVYCSKKKTWKRQESLNYLNICTYKDEPQKRNTPQKRKPCHFLFICHFFCLTFNNIYKHTTREEPLKCHMQKSKAAFLNLDEVTSHFFPIKRSLKL